MKYICIIGLWLCSLLASAQEAGVVQGEWLIQLEPGIAAESWVEEVNTQHPGWALQPKKLLSKRMNIWLVSQVNPVTSSYDLVRRSLRQFPGVVLAQANHNNLELRTQPGDPDYPVQWALNTNVAGAIDAPDAWDLTTSGQTILGGTIVVAVVDGGMYLPHVDLDLFKNFNEIPGNGLDDDNNGYIDDYDGWNAYGSNGTVPNDNHGTQVGGVIGARGNNGTGITGVNWNVKLMPVAGSSTNEATVVEAYGYILEMRALYNQSNGAEGAYVVATNSSFGINFGQPVNFPIWCAMYDSLGAYGVLSAGATINANLNVDVQGDMPTTCPSDYLISVTNTTTSGNKQNSAGYGIASIDIGAPGTNIYSTESFQQYGSSTGTSLATPHVAGAIALMYSALCTNLMEDYGTAHDSLALFIKDAMLTRGFDTVPSLVGRVANGAKLNLRKCIDAVQDYDCLRSEITLTVEDSCNTCQGVAELAVLEGRAPFVYQWSQSTVNNPRNEQQCAGTHTITVTDDFGYSQVRTFSIMAPPTLQVSGQATVPSGSSASDGSITVSATGGMPNLTYLWNTGDTTASLNGLDTGLYHVTVTDAYGCTASESFNLRLVSTGQAFAQTAVRVYPNPALNELRVQWPQEWGTGTVQVYDLTGRIVIQLNGVESGALLEIGELRSGLYGLTIQTAHGERITRKWVKSGSRR